MVFKTRGGNIFHSLKYLVIIGLLMGIFSHVNLTEAQISNCEINIFLPEAIDNLGDIGEFENNLGVNFYSYKWYLDWSDPLEREIPDHFHRFGKLPELTWQPQIEEQGVSFEEVLNKKYDSYLTQFALSVKNLGYPIRINLAPEMNASWVGWGIGGNAANSPQSERAFWQYVVTKFRTLGVNNVEWVWTPNIHFEGETASFSQLYPGDDYIDFLGLDGYNWGTTQSWSQWQSFREIFESSYNDMVSLSSKKILIMEVASTEIGGDKAAWIRNMFAELSNFPQIQGLTWFNINKETDWRINSSENSRRAFVEAIQNGPRILGMDSSESSFIANGEQQNSEEDPNPYSTSQPTSTPEVTISPEATPQEISSHTRSDILEVNNWKEDYNLQLIINLKILLYFLLASIYGVFAIGQLVLVFKKRPS